MEPEPVPPQVAARPGRGLGSLLVLLLAPLAGCVTTANLTPNGQEPPAGAPCQVIATWQNQIVVTADPVNQGQPLPGFAGRLYLFGPQVDFPMTGDGAVVVDMFAEVPTEPGKPKWLEHWVIDKDTLKRLLKRDAIGWGYTLFLPWPNYRQDLNRVCLKLRYEPPKGLPLYGDTAFVTLAAPQDTAVAAKRPGEVQKPAAPVVAAPPGQVQPAAAVLPSRTPPAWTNTLPVTPVPVQGAPTPAGAAQQAGMAPAPPSASVVMPTTFTVPRYGGQ